MKVTTSITLRVGEPGAYEYVAPGESINLPNKDAEALILRGFALNDSKGDEDDDLVDAILDAIDDLKPEAFGKDGKPSVKAIEDIIGESISASDRDKAWEAYQSLASDGQ